MSARHSRTLIGAALLCIGCTTTPLLPSGVVLGKFGGPGVGLEAGPTSTRFQFSCWFIEYNRPLVLRPEGTFDLAATSVPGGSGRPPVLVSIAGQRMEHQVLINATVRRSSGEVTRGEFVATEGVTPDLSNACALSP